MLSPVIENMSKQTFPLCINLLPLTACLYGLFRNCRVAKLLGHLCHGLPRQPFFSAHLTMSRAAGCPGPHSASGCYQRPCRRGSLHRHSSPCWKSLPRLSQPGFGIGSAAIQDWRHWTELGLLECSWCSWAVWAVYSVIPNLNRAPHWKSLATRPQLADTKRWERWGRKQTATCGASLVSPSTIFYILLPSNVLSPEIDEVCCELVTCRHSRSPSWAVDTRWVHLNSLQSPMMSNVTVTITVTEAVFSHLLRKESSDTRTSHAHKQTQGAPFCTCNTRHHTTIHSYKRLIRQFCRQRP